MRICLCRGAVVVGCLGGILKSFKCRGYGSQLNVAYIHSTRRLKKTVQILHVPPSTASPVISIGLNSLVLCARPYTDIFGFRRFEGNYHYTTE
jgi:hypothetical protein